MNFPGSWSATRSKIGDVTGSRRNGGTALNRRIYTQETSRAFGMENKFRPTLTNKRPAPSSSRESEPSTAMTNLKVARRIKWRAEALGVQVYHQDKLAQASGKAFKYAQTARDHAYRDGLIDGTGYRLQQIIGKARFSLAWTLCCHSR